MASDRRDPEGGSGRSRYPGAFRQAFREAAAAIDWQVTAWADDAVTCVDAAGEERTVNVANLYLRASQAETGEWPQIIAEFLDGISSAMDENIAERPLANFAEQLLVRVGLPFGGTGDVRPWSQPLGDTGLQVNLVVDFPRSMAYVNEDQIGASGRPAGEWLARALDNLQARTPADCFQVVHDEAGLLVCEIGDSYDASRALILDRLLPGNDAGFLVAVPHRELLVVQPVRMEAIPHFHLPKLIADKYHEGAPYAVSDEVFWVQGGTWRLFPIRLEDERVVVQPQEEFIAALNRLAPDDEEDEEESPAEQ